MRNYIFKINREYHQVRREISICILSYIEYRLQKRYDCFIVSEYRSVHVIIRDLSDQDYQDLDRIFRNSVGLGIIDQISNNMGFSPKRPIHLEYPKQNRSVKDRNFLQLHHWFNQVMQHKFDSNNSLYVLNFSHVVRFMGLKDLYR